MLAIRMQRTGRKGHAQFRVVVQDSRQTPTSGKFVALVGNYNPHTKTANLFKDKIEFYLKNGAQPSDRATLLFKQEGIKLPDWVKIESKKQGKLRNPEKLRKNQPEDAKVKSEAPEKADEVVDSQAEPEVPAKTAETTAESAVPTESEPDQPSTESPKNEESNEK